MSPVDLAPGQPHASCCGLPFPAPSPGPFLTLPVLCSLYPPALQAACLLPGLQGPSRPISCMMHA